MATTPPKVDPRTVVKSSTRIWANEVALADAGEIPKPFDDAYVMSNNKHFVEKQRYQAADVPDPLP